MAMQLNDHQASVLIVENDANVLHMMRDYLGRAHINVRSAQNGWEAFKRVKEGLLDLIISELNISDMDGSSFREKCLIAPETREVPFLFLTDANQTDAQVHALRGGIDDCITKPFDPVVLVARVQSIIERRVSYERMVRIDPLTRMLNRPTLHQDLDGELGRVKRYDRFASMILFDIDRFSAVNEESGVAMGDLLLTCLSGVILTHIRTMDLAGRYGGAKFLLYLPETDGEGAVTLAERIQRQMSAIAENVSGFELKFSGAVVDVPGHGNELRLLTQRLEKALHHAKRQGAGGVVRWSPEVQDAELAAAKTAQSGD